MNDQIKDYDVSLLQKMLLNPDEKLKIFSARDSPGKIAAAGETQQFGYEKREFYKFIDKKTYYDLSSKIKIKSAFEGLWTNTHGINEEKAKIQ